MAELFFLRHGPRADHATHGESPLHAPYKIYDLSVTEETAQLARDVAQQILDEISVLLPKKNVWVHFSPYLRCCETADLLVSSFSELAAKQYPDTQFKLLLLGDFALSDWVHDKVTHKPPFYDSTEAYQMYTPNVQLLANKRLVSNFRPTTKLGPWNEPDLSLKEFQARCKDYFQKLLATYDKPAHQNDAIVVVTHGYVVLDMLSHFINHPIFEEIPEIALNYARKQNGAWVLAHDCLGMLRRDPHIDATLNLDSNIVYYKTNFIRREDLDENKLFPALGFGGLKSATDVQPRLSFRVKLIDPQGNQNDAQGVPVRPSPNPLCPDARNWDASSKSQSRFSVKSEFRLKVMNDDAFKKAFDITRPPRQPMSPDVSPSSEPSRINSTVDLSKLASNEEIYHPLKLRYSLASDIPVQYLNSKVNSHASLTQFNRNLSNTSSLEFFRTIPNLSGHTSHGSLSPQDQHSDAELPNISEVISRLARVRSLQRRRPQTSTPKFGIISEQDTPPADDTKKFSLNFESNEDVKAKPEPLPAPVASTPLTTVHTRPRRSSSIKFVPSLASGKKREKKSMFYHFNSDSSSTDEMLEDEDTEQKYMWFGQNVDS